MIWAHIGAGTVEILTPETREGMRAAEKVWQSFGSELFVTHIQAGIHGDGSLHPFGRAFDVKYPKRSNGRNIKKALIKSRFQNMAGPNFDIVFHKSHVHIEYDPIDIVLHKSHAHIEYDPIGR